jgi:hypothetical protein
MSVVARLDLSTAMPTRPLTGMLDGVNSRKINTVLLGVKTC